MSLQKKTQIFGTYLIKKSNQPDRGYLFGKKFFLIEQIGFVTPIPTENNPQNEITNLQKKSEYFEEILICNNDQLILSYIIVSLYQDPLLFPQSFLQGQPQLPQRLRPRTFP